MGWSASVLGSRRTIGRSGDGVRSAPRAAHGALCGLARQCGGSGRRHGCVRASEATRAALTAWHLGCSAVGLAAVVGFAGQPCRAAPARLGPGLVRGLAMLDGRAQVAAAGLAGGRAAGAADDSTGGRVVGVAGAVGARLSHPLRKVCSMHDLSNPPRALALDPATLTLDPPAGLAVGARLSHPLRKVRPMHDLSNPSRALALDPATLTLDPQAGLASAPTGSAQSLTLPADGLAGGRAAGAADDSTGGRVVGVAGAVGTRLSHPLRKVCSMHDLSNPTEASAPDSPSPLADPAGAASGRAGDAQAPALALPTDGQAKPGDGLAGGSAVGVALDPASPTAVAVGQVGQHRSRSDFTNKCDCHILPIGCAA